MSDIRQSENYAKYVKSIGWIVGKLGETNVFIRKLGPTSVIKIQRPEKIDISDIDRIVRKFRPLLVKIEPEIGSSTGSSLGENGYLPDRWPLLPTKSLLLNLNMNLNSLPKDTRYEIRKSVENSLSVSLSSDIELFYKLLQETMKIGGWSIPIKKEVTSLYKSFQTDNSSLLFVYQNVIPANAGIYLNRFRVKPGMTDASVAACLLIWDEDTAHYMYAALTKKGRELGASYFLLWETIKFCQKKGLKYLDLEGIYDERFPLKHWRGFTKFKQGWGGKEVEYPGSFTKYANPFVKLLFSLT